MDLLGQVGEQEGYDDVHARAGGGRPTRTAPEVYFGQEFVPATLASRREAAS